MILIKIDVSKEPKCLKVLRQEDRTYDDLQGECKKKTREILGEEQHGYCAYCERKPNSKFHIEHFEPQSKNKSRVLDFSNFLGVCSGREYIEPKKSSLSSDHCQVSRGSEPLNIDPRNQSHISQIYYENDCTVRSSIEIHDKELHDILKLNIQALKKGRNERFKKSYDRLIKDRNQNKLTKENALKKKIKSIKEERIHEYSGYLLYMYSQQLKQYETRTEN